ncbi:MAG: hypothetical protein KDA73_08145 [Rhodobacteraceae bacterium]|nr:hypothetical protein [Paracoccaceae bacterium]
MTIHVPAFSASNARAAARIDDLFEPYFNREDIARRPKTVGTHGEPVEALEQMYAYYEG